MQLGSARAEAGMDAGVPLGSGESGEVALVSLHVIAEALPEGTRLVVRHGLPIHQNAKTAGRVAHTPRSAEISAACFVTSTVR